MTMAFLQMQTWPRSMNISEQEVGLTFPNTGGSNCPTKCLKGLPFWKDMDLNSSPRSFLLLASAKGGSTLQEHYLDTNPWCPTNTFQTLHVLTIFGWKKKRISDKNPTIPIFFPTTPVFFPTKPIIFSTKTHIIEKPGFVQPVNNP